ncbi:hypothetical protein [Algimonas porphyrae]|uniref:DUF3108 domain-containing protein n=2 Tax=Algimonas porphyrae TaxID=1128113 RepID=A0ABQ5UYX4_9PROT|nr:hypothetical protein GCM10007854_05350 [Algimonas porphyrae]
MNRLIPVVLTLLMSAPVAAQDKDADTRIAERDLREMKQILPGFYTNEEQVYFQSNLDMAEDRRLPRLTLKIEKDGDGFKATTTSSTGRQTEARLEYRVEDGQILSREYRDGEVDCERIFSREFNSFRGEGCGGMVVADAQGFQFGMPDNPFHMLRARAFKCWASPRKADGTYAFYNDLVLHDQGGRVWIDATDEHERVGFRIRNVQWPTGINRDSLVLYTYRGDDADYAPSYTWTDPSAERLAINTRWLQVSCTAGDATIIPNINLKTGSGN